MPVGTPVTSIKEISPFASSKKFGPSVDLKAVYCFLLLLKRAKALTRIPKYTVVRSISPLKTTEIVPSYISYNRLWKMNSQGPSGIDPNIS